MALALGSVVVAVVGWRRSAAEVVGLRPEVVGLRREVKTADKRAQDREREVSRLEGRISHLEKELSELKPTRLPAQKVWADTINGSERIEERLKLVQDIFEQLASGDPIRKDVGDWLIKVNDVHEKAKLWYASDPTMQSKIEQAVKTPWDEPVVAAAEKHRQALEAAAEDWFKWAKDESLSPAGLKDNIDLVTDEAVTSILKDWLLKTKNQQLQPWTLRVTKGTTADGYNPKRRVSVWGGGSGWGGKEWVEGDWTTWEPGTGHDYREDPQVKDLHFVWQLGNPMSVMLEADGWTYNDKLIDDRLSGPLAMWLFNYFGSAWKGDGPNQVWFEILDCPGPPQGWRSNTAILGE